MVELKSKKTGKILLIGEIIKETETKVKLHTSSNWYKKSKIIIQYVIACAILIVSNLNYGIYN
ncbi:hypothetical protein UMM65_02260 [Aureibaculum sp. 2210JD6-5]|uniref:hypothetical protein n=1 Tax=Aureibaculum sp. 2210JD6-5 TaxID=3103957 RepID=UPI002AAE2829|nr:hypothetical protein [Aureibaculum sp. 2210JD6-5]MDY7394049.1 hypothetical protein [Aureibaculum sp. 2210JD6-5]